MSSLSCDKSERSKEILNTAGASTEAVGSENYQKNHMALIFEKGLSFSGFERNRIFLAKAKGGYADVSDVSGADSVGDCRSACVADFDDDGDPDLFVNAIQHELHHLFRNDLGTKQGNFVKFRLKAQAGHPDAIGAQVSVSLGARKQAQVLSCGTGFASQNALELIFGVAKEDRVEVEVRWPGRAVESFGAVPTNARYLLVEGSGKPKLIPAKTSSFADPFAPGLHFGINDPLPELRVGNGNKVQTKGSKELILNFWATTCLSCIAEIPLFETLRKGGQYRVEMISLDPESQREAAAALLKKRGYLGSSHLLETEQAEKLFDLAELAIPLTVVISKDGRVKRIIQGKVNASQF